MHHLDFLKKIAQINRLPNLAELTLASLYVQQTQTVANTNTDTENKAAIQTDSAG